MARGKPGIAGWGIVAGLAAVVLIGSIATASNPELSEPAETDALAPAEIASPVPSPTPLTETTTVAVDEAVPFAEQTSVGTRRPAPPADAARPPQQGACDPNYAGACVPIDSDVDCAGGSGNGPSYVSGPVQVVGTDIYDLDRDGDGVGCE